MSPKPYPTNDNAVRQSNQAEHQGNISQRINQSIESHNRSETDDLKLKLAYIRLAIGKVPVNVNAGSQQKAAAWKQAATAGLKVLNAKRPTRKAIHSAFAELRRFDDRNLSVCQE